MGRNLTFATGVAGAVGMLAGCVDGSGLGSSRPETAATAAAERPAATQLVDRDVEVPDVFQTSEAALWDGRPSLGGIWVAHPDVTDPERVLIRNGSTGKTVVGALFRRERNNPGPRIQVSSDAAAALGMLAGAPVELSVTALRREEAPEPAAEPVDAQAVAEGTAPDPVAGAEGATARAEGAPTEPAADIAATDAEPAAESAAPQPRRGFLGGLFAPRNPSEPLSAIAPPSETDGTVTDAAVTVDTAAESPPAAAEQQAPSAPAASAVQDPAPAQSRSRSSGGFLAGLFAPRRAAEPLSAIGAVGSTTAASAATDAAALATAPVQTAALDPAPAAGAPAAGLSDPYVQIGTFTQEDNAQSIAAAMRQNGVIPVVDEQRQGGTTVWRILVGPASTTDERATLLDKVKGLGFSDAYAVSR